MRPILAFISFLIPFMSYSQDAVKNNCVSFGELMKVSQQANTSKMEELLKPHGFTLTADNKPSVIFSTDEMSMLTFKRENDSLISIEYNFEQTDCASAIEKEILSSGFTKDFKWESGKSISYGYEGKSIGLYIYKAMKTVENDGKSVEAASYVITILPSSSYLARKEKYRSNPRITITEY